MVDPSASLMQVRDQDLYYLCGLYIQKLKI